jgi:hypothetical protein
MLARSSSGAVFGINGCQECAVGGRITSSSGLLRLGFFDGLSVFLDTASSFNY